MGFWDSESGDNLLKGVVGDTANPPRMKDEYIVDFLRRIPESRVDFNEKYPGMLTAEKTRLDPLSVSAMIPAVDATTVEDNWQHRMVTKGIYTVGKNGGSRAGGNR